MPDILNRETRFTVSFWMYPRATSATDMVVSIYGNNPDHFWSLPDSNFKWRTFQPTHNLISNATVPLYDWTFITCVYDGTSKIMYINGSEDNSVVISGIHLDSSAGFSLGQTWRDW